MATELRYIQLINVHSAALFKDRGFLDMSPFCRQYFVILQATTLHFSQSEGGTRERICNAWERLAFYEFKKDVTPPPPLPSLTSVISTRGSPRFSQSRIKMWQMIRTVRVWGMTVIVFSSCGSQNFIKKNIKKKEIPLGVSTLSFVIFLGGEGFQITHTFQYKDACACD